ncbi:MAG: tRNA (guanosine(46)-N7)-methyltransferase TrmB [Gammaproteobacteria bacterium]|nr:tRNA (guanosine(46)-N7)-methyltransferase TrmB [Gammaproteobacteria bacterium]|tara:strand:- start:1019 stop:1705 length:687 start_codon:yes stop_codon:yes gene_type:complete
MILNKRTIRSFVRRTGRLTPSQSKALKEFWPKIGIEHEIRLLDLDANFGRTAPIVLEIGFGNGDSMVKMADEKPEKNYLGIEVYEPGIGHCLIMARNLALKNLRIIAHDAIEVLEHQIPLKSINRVNLYFPDPWPKKRHHKRRIIQTRFLKMIADRLKDNGTLNIATDWESYAEHIEETFSYADYFICTERREHSGDQPFERPRTKFEQRGLKRGHKIWDWCFKKANH